MPVISYEDFAYPSEEEKDEEENEHEEENDEEESEQEEENEQDKNEQMQGLDGYGHHDEGSVGSNDTSAEVNHLNDDFDEYASFGTDLEKYQYDQGRWNGIPNPRKYTIAKKKSRKQKTKSPKDDEPGSSKRAKRSKPKAVPKSTQEEDLPTEGEIHFDTEESLWYTHKNDDIYVTGKHRNGHVFQKVC